MELTVWMKMGSCGRDCWGGQDGWQRDVENFLINSSGYFFGYLDKKGLIFREKNAIISIGD